MTQERRIVWEKWLDPYGADDEISPDLEDEENTSYIDDEESGQGSGDQLEELLDTPHKMVLTPMGAIPVTEYSLPGKIFNFWTGHTNFDITYDVQEVLEAIPGVETLDIFTRYRFRVGIGKVFTGSLVKSSIQDSLINVDR